jgi:hypothetical protein
MPRMRHPGTFAEPQQAASDKPVAAAISRLYHASSRCDVY